MSLIKIESPWKERINIVLRVAFCVLVVCIIFFYIDRDGEEFITFYRKILTINEDFWNMLTTFFTGGAAICAILAYRQSIEMRKHSSFDAVFTQLLGGLQDLINKKVLQETKFKQNLQNIQPSFFQHLQKYDSNNDVFLNFCIIYESYSQSKIPSKLDENEIKQLWNSYSNSLIHKSNFYNCFKYIYHIVNLVMESPLDNEQKKKYVGIVQAQLNLDILFCYLINQVVANRSINSTYRIQLKEYSFFKNLFKDNDGYGKLVKDTIPTSIIELFNKRA